MNSFPAMVQQIERLLKACRRIEDNAEELQLEMPSNYPPSAIEIIEKNYEKWFTDAKQAVPPILVARLEQQYNDRGNQPRIKTLWQDPTGVYTPSKSAAPIFDQEPLWNNPQEPTFQEPFRVQQDILRLAIHMYRSHSEDILNGKRKSSIDIQLRQALATVGKDHYTLATIDDLFLSAGADIEWLVEPHRYYQSSRGDRIHGWIEGIGLYVPEQQVEVVSNVLVNVLANENITGSSRSALESALKKLRPEPTQPVQSIEATPVAGASSLVTVSSDTREQSEDKRPTIFVGHGRSKVYVELVLHLRDEWDAEVVFFEDENRTGQQITSILDSMMERLKAAIIVMTAEDTLKDGTRRARQNVIHEAGLMHARVGFDNVALLRAPEAEKFTNMDGLIYIPLDENNIQHSFYTIDGFLKRVGFKRKFD